MRIEPMPDDPAVREQAAALLVAGFREHWPDAWPTLDDAREEVADVCVPENIAFVAYDDAGLLAGWIGGAHSYAYVWELHPLVVDPARQRTGIGRVLVAALEDAVRERGGLTITLGSDDQDGMTSLSGVDLYDDLPGKIASIQNLRGHPYGFYQRCGYTITGVVPDANGFGHPDILMAKRLGGA